MFVKNLVVGELETNCYIVTDLNTKDCLIIDPGDSADLIGEYIVKNDLKPKHIIATHGHFDHILASFELQLSFDIPVSVHKFDLPILKKMKTSAKYWLRREIIELPPVKTKFIDEKSTICLGKDVLGIIHTPGHTPGSICLYCKREKIIFPGDLIFANGVGRTDFSYSSSKALNQSIVTVKRQFSQYRAFPGHGEEFIV